MKRAQLERILFLVEKASRGKLEEKKTEVKRCNFYNSGFCNRGSDCKFVHPPDVCESFEASGIRASMSTQSLGVLAENFVTSLTGLDQ